MDLRDGFSKGGRRPVIAILLALAAVWLVGPAQTAVAGPFTDFIVNESSGSCAVQAAHVDATPSGTSLYGRRQWEFGMHTNSTSAPASSISVQSGYAPARLLSQPPFEPCSGAALASLPYVASEPSLHPGDCICTFLYEAPASTDVVGFASSRSATPVRIPVGGTDQVEVATLQVTDPALVGLLKLSIISSVPGTTYVSSVAPSGATSLPQAGGVQFVLFTTLNQSYTFTGTLHVPNQVGRPFRSKPLVDFLLDGSGSNSLVSGPVSSQVIPVPSLDGGTPGAGSVTFAASGGGGSWSVNISTSSRLFYLATPVPQRCAGNFDCQDRGGQDRDGQD